MSNNFVPQSPPPPYVPPTFVAPHQPATSQPRRPSAQRTPEGRKSFIVTLLLACFLGFIGADRFYLGKKRSALFKLFTFGGLGYWALIDVLVTMFGGQRDVWGLRLDGYDRHKKTVWLVLGCLICCGIAFQIIALLIMTSVDSDGMTQSGWIVVAVLSGVIILVLAAALFRYSKRRKSKNESAGVQNDTQSMAEVLADLASVRQLHFKHAASGDQLAARIVDLLDSFASNLAEFFQRLPNKAKPRNQKRAEREYKKHLTLLNEALGREYLLDLVENPQLWDRPGERIREVLNALSDLDSEVLENVRRLNARRKLVFQVEIGEFGQFAETD